MTQAHRYRPHKLAQVADFPAALRHPGQPPRHNLPEHPAQARAGDAVDDDDAHGRDENEDRAERRRLVGAAGDVEGEDPDGELLEQRRLAAPEDVHLGPALPLDDAPVGHGRSRRDRAHLHRDVPLLLRVVGERLERRVVDELRHRSDQRQLALDGRLGRRAHVRTEHQHQRKRQEPESSHGSSPHWGRSSAQPRARSTARRQPSQRAARVAGSIAGVNVRSIVQRRLRSSSDRHRPAPSPARYAAPSAVVSITLGRSTATFMMSAWNWQRKSFAAAPPSTRSSLTPIPASAAIAPSTSRLWKAIASSAARARCAPVVPRVSPTIVPRAYMSQYGAPSPTKAGTK